MHNEDNPKNESFDFSVLAESVSTDVKIDIKGVAGSAGLTFEAPVVEKSDVQIGFAHELLENITPHPEFAHLDSLEAGDASSVAASPLETAEKSRPAFVEYPLAKAALARLIASTPAFDSVQAERFIEQNVAHKEGDSLVNEAATAQTNLPEATASIGSELPELLNAFTIGSEVMRAPAKVQTPASAQTAPQISSKSAGQMQEMVDLFFVGADEEAQGQQIHLQFKGEVLGGLYLTLKKTELGMVAHFVVQDANTRRLVESHAHLLVARLQKKGMRIVETVVEMKGDELAVKPSDFFSDGDKFDGF